MTGEYRNTLDDKGRISIPSRLRNELGGDRVYITRGIENCLWVMLPDKFNMIRDEITKTPGYMFNKATRTLSRRLIAPAVTVDIDKTGRIIIPQALREALNMNSRDDITILGIDDYIELWNTETYRQWNDENDDTICELAQSLGERLGGI